MRVGSLSSMDISAGALSAYRRQMDTIAENLANAQTTMTATGEPYRRKDVVFRVDEINQAVGDVIAPQALKGLRQTRAGHLQPMAAPASGRSEKLASVLVDSITDDPTPFVEVFDPSHPDAYENGIVKYPNVDTAVEMVNLVLATRAYEANLASLAAMRQIYESALQMGRTA
ncbi:MAG: flagellar basal body rod protein FlgC [Candidatus Eisenbacteria bacterium]|nr:flagellar basal body rod protein FlgC [Candidatus Eisenbacteria bacterium]